MVTEKNDLFETYGASQRYYYDLKDEETNHIQHYNQKEKHKGFANKIKETFKSGFLPQGYPTSVSEDYLEYQLWDTVQAFCSSITGMLATQAILKGYGVGNEKATVMAASITWMLKDGAGMIGRIMFAWLKGTQLDCDAKRWRLCADVLNDTAIFLDLLAPIFKSYFIFIACLSSITRSIVGVAGGATRAALTLHQARRNNMADVSAKDGSQETLVNLMALIASFILTPIVADRPILVWFLFILFTFFHLFANYRAVSCVVMETLNMNRLYIVMQHFIEHEAFLSPKQVNKLEPVLRRHCNFKDICIGSKLGSIIRTYKIHNSDLEEILKNERNQYIVSFDQGKVYVALRHGVDDSIILQSSIMAILLDIALRSSDINSQYLNSIRSCIDKGNPHSTFQRLKPYVEDLNVKLVKGLSANGWDLTKYHLNADEWRYQWPDKAL
ncbi:RUS family member 1-like [Clytia hemisphaerica]|uniref:Uncharacterized protein n=1 Tax=Clytia hemisphaerica TaxID=252671 RepID=A0A7M5U0H4_9CNID